MNIEQSADLFEKVRWTSITTFATQCPNHEGKRDSLSVREGHTNIMVHCFAGCTFFEVAAALGVSPLVFKLGSEDETVNQPNQAARSRLRRLRQKVAPVMFAEVAEAALSPSASRLAAAWVKYPYLMDLEYEEAMSMWWVVRDGPVFEMIRGPGPPRWGWDVERDQAEKALRIENRRRNG
jgi:hypothetical protein